MCPKTKYAFVLPGGGFRGYYQVGVLEALLGAGITPGFVAGQSVGALNGALLAQNKFDQLKDLWQHVHDNGYEEIWKSWIIREKAGSIKPKVGGVLESILTGGLLSRQGLGSLDPLREKLRRHIRIEDFVVPFRCGTVSYSDGLYHTISPETCPNSQVLADGVLASATMPLLWAPVQELQLTSGPITQLVDGGMKSVTPLKEAVDFIGLQPDAEDWVILVIHCNDGQLPAHPEPFDLVGIISRTLDMFQNNVFQNDLKTFSLINQLVLASGQDRIGNYLHIPSLVIQPSRDEIGSTLDSRPEILRRRFALGYRHGRELLQTLDL